jgi:hypothetical protein
MCLACPHISCAHGMDRTAGVSVTVAGEEGYQPGGTVGAPRAVAVAVFGEQNSDVYLQEGHTCMRGRAACNYTPPLEL